MRSIAMLIFIFLLLVEYLIPDRKNEKIKFELNWKKIQFKRFIKNRYISNYVLGICWILFIKFFGRSFLEFYNHEHLRFFGAEQFRTLNVFSGVLFFLLFDYLTYWWHRANHYFYFLRRFHQVHHSDLEVDSSTTLRFHFIEIFLQFIFKMILAFIFKIHLIYLFFFESLLLVFGICHHSNIYLPQKITKLVSFVIVTPRYHYNHHLLDLKYANSNYGSIFTFWDRLHRTYSPPLFENNKELGLINKRKVSKLSLWDLLKMPFNL